jgi:hypothetical protein
MSVEVADENGPYAQIASNQGYQDLVNASEGDSVLRTFFYYGATDNPREAASHLINLQASADVMHTARVLAAAIIGRNYVILTRGESAE